MPKTKPEIKTIQKRSDKHGNFFIVEQEPRYNNWRIYVHIVSESYRRMIGEVDTENRVLFVRRDKGKHYHHQMRSYGFNWKVINDIADLEHVMMMEVDGDHRQYYMIPVQFIKENGVVKQFTAFDFEVQVFLRVEYFERFKVGFTFVKGRVKK